MAHWLAVDMEDGVTGLWKGFALGQIVVCFLYAVVFQGTDWQEVFLLNRRRKQEEQEELEKEAILNQQA